MNILVIGGGGREHALAWKLAQSARVGQVFVAPGNAGTAAEPKVANVAIAADDVPGLYRLAQDRAVDFTVVGPEAPLVAGIVNTFRDGGLKIFGPSRAAAQLEGSKAFAKAFMQRHHVPTARYGVFTELAPAADFVHDHGTPVVIKADGLAAGKGVVIAQTQEEATATLRAMLVEDRFGAAGRQVVVEECLTGEEASFICMVDGEQILPLASSQDHKPRDAGDVGPNTGGMGAYSPAPIMTAALLQEVVETIVRPTVAGLAAEGHTYIGFLYVGLMITPEGTPRVLEFNCRLGDPETQPILLRLQSDLAGLIEHALAGQLAHCTTRWDPRPALGVVLAAGGYPDTYRKGLPILGLDQAGQADVKVFHAGTAWQDEQIMTAGGRVLCVTALGTTVSEAKDRAYGAVAPVYWDDMFYRHDIGYRAVAREQAARPA